LARQPYIILVYRELVGRNKKSFTWRTTLQGCKGNGVGFGFGFGLAIQVTALNGTQKRIRVVSACWRATDRYRPSHKLRSMIVLRATNPVTDLARVTQPPVGASLKH
jgi:hypothetical protein